MPGHPLSPLIAGADPARGLDLLLVKRAAARLQFAATQRGPRGFPGASLCLLVSSAAI